MKPFGERLPEVVTAIPGPASRALAARLASVESRNVTDLGAPGPIFWDAATGANVRDVDGNVFLDLGGAFGVAAVGHARGEITTAISAQATRLLHGMGDIHPSEVKVRLLEELARRSPWPDTRSILATSGSEAVEAALKTALLATGRPGIVAFEGAYHGLTMGSLATTYRQHFRAPFAARTYDNVHFLPFPGSSHEADEALDALKKLSDGRSDIGAIIVEPIQGRAGVRIPPAGFLRALREHATERGTILIADEIFTGFGRTGEMFFSVSEGCSPDVICAGKALGGGMPLSVCMGSTDVMDSWPESTGEAIHTSTFLGHPVACAAALATMQTLDADSLVERAKVEGERWLVRLHAALADSAHVHDVRGRGMMIGIELAPSGRTPLSGIEQVRRLLERGLLLLPAGSHGEVLELTPSLAITQEQMDYTTETLADLLT